MGRNGGHVFPVYSFRDRGSEFYSLAHLLRLEAVSEANKSHFCPANVLFVPMSLKQVFAIEDSAAAIRLAKQCWRIVTQLMPSMIEKRDCQKRGFGQIDSGPLGMVCLTSDARLS